jgi:hypothetical protein
LLPAAGLSFHSTPAAVPDGPYAVETFTTRKAGEQARATSCSAVATETCPADPAPTSFGTVQLAVVADVRTAEGDGDSDGDDDGDSDGDGDEDSDGDDDGDADGDVVVAVVADDELHAVAASSPAASIIMPATPWCPVRVFMKITISFFTFEISQPGLASIPALFTTVTVPVTVTA